MSRIRAALLKGAVMTAITVYQRLMRDSMSLRIRKLAAHKLARLEGGLAGLEAERLTIVGVMRHEDSNEGRGTAEAPLTGFGVVTATTVRASDRERIRDGHDARTSEDRTTWRNFRDRDNPYAGEGLRHMREDFRMGEGLPPADKCSDVTTYVVPTWAVAVEADERRKLGRGFATRKPATEADFRKSATWRERKSQAVEAHMRQARMREAVTRGTSATWRHDFTSQ